MRHELCIDNRNEPKWATTLAAADRVDAGLIVYAAMFVATPHDIAEHGAETDDWQRSAIPEAVRAFFRSERAAVAAGSQRDLWRVSRLDDRIRIVRDPYRWDDRLAYVGRMAPCWRP